MCGFVGLTQVLQPSLASICARSTCHELDRSLGFPGCSGVKSALLEGTTASHVLPSGPSKCPQRANLHRAAQACTPPQQHLSAPANHPCHVTCTPTLPYRLVVFHAFIPPAAASLALANPNAKARITGNTADVEGGYCALADGLAERNYWVMDLGAPRQVAFVRVGDLVRGWLGAGRKRWACGQ